jgi:ribosomal protein S18 acetylase RimI-like enzyme
MPNIQYDTLINPLYDEIRALDGGLHQYSLDHLGESVINRYARFAVVARSEDGELVGGIYGDMVWEWLHIQTLWVDDTYRGRDIGTRLLRMIEREASAHGCHGSHLETTGFQALSFYQKNGYTIFGELGNKPAGHTWYYLKKLLEPAESEDNTP